MPLSFFAVISSVHDPERLQPLGVFANCPYLARMPLGIFAVSSSSVPVTLSHVALALRNLSKITFFDAKPPLSEAVTLSPSKLFFGNHRLFLRRSQILNVTASNLSLAVKIHNGTTPGNP